MSTADLLERLEHLDNGERLAVIERATHLIRQGLTDPAQARQTEDERIRRAAASVADLYEPGGEHTEWTALDGENVLDYADEK